MIGRLLPDRSRLIREIADCLTISEARWDGDPQTIVHIDRLLPSLAVPRGIRESETDADTARWRVLTAKPPHLYGFPARSEALKEFHRADAKKGRRPARPRSRRRPCRRRARVALRGGTRRRDRA
jgi:hypothetical protein